MVFNSGQKYCRMLQREHSAILSTFIKLPVAIKIFVVSIFEWPFYSGFTVVYILLSVKNGIEFQYHSIVFCSIFSRASLVFSSYRHHRDLLVIALLWASLLLTSHRHDRDLLVIV